MKDKYNRNIDYLRISITDRCNLRCVYCMPEGGIQSIPHCEILSYDEIIRLCKIFAQLGITKIKITGGEPLVRKGACELIDKLKKLDGISQVTLTTNAVNLKENLQSLKQSGIDGINISFDSLDKETYVSLAKVDSYDKALSGLNAAMESGLNVKVNVVPVCDDKNIIDMARLAKENNVQVRFIEIMPLGEGRKYKLKTEDEMLKVLESVYGKACVTNSVKGNGPARYYAFDSFKGNIGFVSAMSHQFCSECNRVRLTAEGYLKTCLQYDDGVDLKVLLRSGKSDEEIKSAIISAINEKPLCHDFNSYKEHKESDERLMSQIGG